MYDVAFAGTGMAAVLAAHALRDTGCRMVGVDDGLSDEDEHTFAFWSCRPTALDAAVTHSWSRLRVVGPTRTVDVDIGPYRYHLCRAGDVRRRLLPELPVVEGRVVDVRSDDDAATVVLGDGVIRARHVLDSRPPVPVPTRGASLLQTFVGAWIEPAADAFDPSVATLLDFRLADGHVSFRYVLPVGPRRAFVEGVHIGPDAHRVDLAPWLARLGVAEAVVRSREGGVTWMTDRPFSRRAGRVLRIGRAGGLLKPSTGYALVRMADDAVAVAASLARHGHPFDLPRPRRFPALLDAWMLELIARRPHAVPRVFERLFDGNPGPRVLRFLDEEATLLETVRLGLSLPLPAMAAAALRWSARRLFVLPGAPRIG